MKYLKRFNEDIEATIKANGNISANIDPKFDDVNTIYDKRWEVELSEYFTINYHGKLYKFKKDNIMLHSDMVQITYASTPLNSNQEGEIWGVPDTLEFDVYFAKDAQDGKIRMTVDVTYGDLMVSEFTIDAPNKITIGEYTSYGSKFDPSNTEFALDSNTLQSLVNYFNAFDHGIHLTVEDLKFLSTIEHTDPTN